MAFLWYTLLGFFLVFVDLVLIPGLIFVILGSCVIIYGIYLNYVDNGLWAALVHLMIVLATIPKIVTWSLNRISLKGEFRNEDGYVGVPDYTHYIGMEGTAHSVLRPAGTVEIDLEGKRVHLDCVAQNGFVEKGCRVKIVEVRGPSLVVEAAEA